MSRFSLAQFGLVVFQAHIYVKDVFITHAYQQPTPHALCFTRSVTMDKEDVRNLWSGNRHDKSTVAYETAIRDAIQYVFDQKYNNSYTYTDSNTDSDMDIDKASTVVLSDDDDDKMSNDVHMQGSGSSDDDDDNNDTMLLMKIQYSDDEEKSMSVNGEDPTKNTIGLTNTTRIPPRLPSRECIRWIKPDVMSRACGESTAPSVPIQCLQCTAYQAHTKAAAETYRKTLNSYTKTVSELILGVKTLIERYPELRVDSSDERVYYMIQAALGRNNLVQEMVRLAAVAHIPHNNVDVVQIANIHEALNVCHSDKDALRMILSRYADLYVNYIRVWRDMCSRVVGDLTTLDFIELTGLRPGVSDGEPWSEAIAYICRIEEKLRGLSPDDMSHECSQRLCKLKRRLSHCTILKSDVSFSKKPITVHEPAREIEEVRDILDTHSSRWCWDVHMTELYMDIRSDLTILATLIDVGRMAITTLLHDRSVLVSRLRSVTRDLSSAELALREIKSQRNSSVFFN